MLPQLKGGRQINRIVDSGIEFSGKADRSGLVVAKAIQGEAAQEGEMLDGIAQADAAGILAKSHAKVPMQATVGLRPSCAIRMRKPVVATQRVAILASAPARCGSRRHG